jgi:SAM-dependent methyltransferase
MGLLDRLAEDPRSFTWLRKVAEANFVAVRRVVRREIDLARRARTLDLGCGTGELAPLFRHHDYLGLDLSLPYVAYARRRFPGVPFGVCDASRVPLADCSCDNVLIFGVLHHMDDGLAGRVAGEVARVLRPGGCFLLIEDRRDVPAWNVIGRVIHAMDAGENIRDREGYGSLLPAGDLREVRTFTFTSGFCDYYAFHLERTGAPARSKSAVNT